MYKILNWRKKKPPHIVQSKYSDFYRANRSKYCRIIYFNDKQQLETKSNCIFTAKCGILSFIPLFCIEQLKHFSNQYLILISVLQQIPDASPLGRYTTVIPLGIKIFFSAINSIIKNIIDHREDYKINNKCVKVFRNGILVQEKWSEIGVGDILKIENNDVFPADIIVLSSSELHGICHIETTDLDGENNLKIRQCPQETSYCKELHDFLGLNGIIECELPNKLIYNFLGRLTIANNYPIPLDNKRFLPRGSVLRDTKWIFGAVIYTGHETKLMLNKIIDCSKESAMDKIVNSQIRIMFLLILLLSFVYAVCYTWWIKEHFEMHWYLKINDVNAYTFVLHMISFFILYHSLIPVTLQVYIDFVRLIQAWLIHNDIDMYHEESNTPAMVRSPNLNIELGKVKYIFSDKTGTLTKNDMTFKHCSIAGELYPEGSQNIIKNNLINHPTKKYILEFLRILSVCHTVIPEKSKYTNEIVYNTSSPDEQALVIGSRQFGFTFHTRCPKSVTITASGVEERYEILNILEFTNSRKRMSVIVRTPDSKIRLYCKGADTAIFKCLSRSGNKYKNQTMVHLNNFARAGYRTLCFAYVNISENFYKTWKYEYIKATAVLINRDTAKNKVADKIERELKLIGVTAIENKLQDNVPKTIQALMNADIKIWILTGDKQETAINIGFSTSLITQNSPIIIFNQSQLMDLKQAILNTTYNLDVKVQNANWTMVINGHSLKHALSDDLKMDFLKLCIHCRSVICNRITPSQKSEVVDFVTKYANEVTLAIGDGANDVPMLNKASIGVGILGLEGLQASNASDYSIAQFKYLSKLLFVHGAWNYERISKMIYFSYYKGILFYALQLWFEIYSGWSSQVLFDRWSICSYNMIFTAAPPLMIGLFQTTYSADTRLKCPQLYSQTRYVFNYKMFSMWITVAVCHSILLFWICLFIMKYEIIWMNGRVGDYSVLGNIVYTCTLTTVCLKAGLHVQSWSFIVHLATWTSILSWFSFIIIYSYFQKILLNYSIFIGLNKIIFSSSIFWITIVFTTSTVLMLDLAAVIVKRTLGM